MKQIIAAFDQGAASLKDTIARLEAERADAVRRLSGRKGGEKELRAITEQIDAQLAELRKRQREILEDFRRGLAMLKVPEGARDAAEAIAQIARTLREAADAGATAAEQMEYFKRSIEDLTTRLGRELRDEERETIGLLMREIDLRKERDEVIKQAAEDEAAVRRRAGLERALTPAQQAALEIRKIRERRDERLRELDNEQRLLDAQLEGRKELFGLSLGQLSLDDARRALLERQVALEREITAEIVACVRAQKDMLAALAAGGVPELPVGLLPAGFRFPGQVVVEKQVLEFHFDGVPSDPRAFAQAVAAVLPQAMNKIITANAMGAAWGRPLP